MTDFIDTSVLVSAMIGGEAHHDECRPLVAGGKMHMYAHGIAETFSTLTGGKRSFRLMPGLASELLEQSFLPRLHVQSLAPRETIRAMRDCKARGVRGGAIFDYLHLVAARRAKASRFYTLNVRNFVAFHRQGDPQIVHPRD